MIEFDNHIR